MVVASTNFHMALIQSRGVKMGSRLRRMKANATTDWAHPMWVNDPRSAPGGGAKRSKSRGGLNQNACVCRDA